MAIASFDKTFVVSDTASIAQIRQNLERPQVAIVNVRDYKAENAKGIKLLRQRFDLSPPK